jgi:hypothetical protein
MWQPNMVERGLFKWNKWRNSIIRNWVECQHEPAKLARLLTLGVERELNEIGLPALSVLELYWMSCLTSDFNLDYPATYAKIVTPVGVQIGGHEIDPGIRVYPPPVINEKDLTYESRQFGFSKAALKALYSDTSSYKMLLQSSHELLDVLNRMRGRPTISGKRGPIPDYSDRLTIQCAALKNTRMSYVEIADKLHLPVTRPIFSRQSDVTVNLVRRGRKLLKELPT